MTTAPTEQDARHVARLVIDAVSPLRVVLFGSIARGEAAPRDIDLLIVMPEGTNRLQVAQDLHELMGDHAEFMVPVDFVVVTPSVLERFSSSVFSAYPAMLDEGMELYAAA